MPYARPPLRSAFAAPIAALFVVGRNGATLRDTPRHNGIILGELTPGIVFQGLWMPGRLWAQRLPSLGGGYVSNFEVREV